MYAKEYYMLLLSALAVGFSITGFTVFTNPIMGLVMILLLAISFTLHEIFHRIEAKRLGYIAFYRINKMGFLLTLVSFFLPFKIIAPGEVAFYSIYKVPSIRDIATISLVGPLSNILLAVVLKITGIILVMQGANNYIVDLMLRIGSFNGYIAFFNLIPIPPLDGSKIVKYSLFLWFVLLILSTIMFII